MKMNESMRDKATLPSMAFNLFWLIHTCTHQNRAIFVSQVLDIWEVGLLMFCKHITCHRHYFLWKENCLRRDIYPISVLFLFLRKNKIGLYNVILAWCQNTSGFVLVPRRFQNFCVLRSYITFFRWSIFKGSHSY